MFLVFPVFFFLRTYKSYDGPTPDRGIQPIVYEYKIHSLEVHSELENSYGHDLLKLEKNKFSSRAKK
jgi:phosphatidylethanolamine-binding protein (PEBP) family uncharacterized protein